MAKSNASTLSQVRIIGGQYRRRLLSFIDADGLRPTPDRVRETLFNWLDFELPNARVLDCCAGSGVLGFEALSRGAAHVTLIEPNRAQYQQLVASQTLLAIPNTAMTLYPLTAQATLPQLSGSAPFDVVFLDPPYGLALWDTLLALLIEHQLISSDTRLYIEADRPLSEAMPMTFSQLQVIKQKKMGKIYLGLLGWDATNASR